MFHVPEAGRITTGPMASDSTYDNNGAFRLKSPYVKNATLYIIASDGLGWEHVSVHGNRNNTEYTPSWNEMCFIKAMFWDAEDVAIQIHPAKSQYVNLHQHALHLWRPIGATIPLPPLITV